jgi:hypothetical protein
MAAEKEMETDELTKFERANAILYEFVGKRPYNKCA